VSTRKTKNPSRESMPRRRRLVEGVLMALASVALIDALFGEHGFVERLKASDERRALLEQIASVERTNGELRDEIGRLKSDPAAIEDLARRTLGMIKPGERVFILRDVPPPEP
jgi:cell division protein FtsB